MFDTGTGLRIDDKGERGGGKFVHQDYHLELVKKANGYFILP